MGSVIAGAGGAAGGGWASDDAIVPLVMFPQTWEDAPKRPARPEPVERWELPYGVRGIPIQFRAELWRDDQLTSPVCPHGAAALPDPKRPGYSWVITLIDLATGAVSLPLSPEQVAAWPAPAVPRPGSR
jgi:hypothetical protein